MKERNVTLNGENFIAVSESGTTDVQEHCRRCALKIGCCATECVLFKSDYLIKA